MQTRGCRMMLAVVGGLLLIWVTLSVMLAPTSQATVQAALPAATDATREVVINEVAWMGTAASASDEWIELYNTTAATITLDGWRITSNDGMTLDLIGKIAPQGFYLIERTNDETVADIPANLTTGFGYGLSNDGEILTLTNAVDEIIDTANADGGTWPAGNKDARITMERIDPTLPDTSDNWATNDGVTINGLDADGNSILGTPKARNSVYVIPFQERAELQIRKSGPITRTAGEVITYHVTLTNTGGHIAEQTRLTDTLPADVHFITQSSEFTFTQAAGALHWDLGAVMTGTPYAITVIGQVAPTAPGGDLVNRITATTRTPSPAPYTSARCTTTVSPIAADVAVALTGPVTATAGSTQRYDLTVANVGELRADNVALTYTYPAEATVVGHTPNYGTIQMHPPGKLIWRVGDLAPGATVPLTVSVHISAEAAGLLTYHLAATTASDDPHPDNDAAAWTTQVGEPRVLINGVLYDGYAPEPAGEAVQLINVGTAPATLAGWELCRDKSDAYECHPIPTMTLERQQRVWLAKEIMGFAAAFGFPPDYALGDDWFTSPGLTNDSGDEVLLRDADEIIVDAMVYKAGKTPIAGWTGPGVAPYGVGREEGQILARIPDEATGLPIADTDTAADWLQTTGNITHGRRVRYPGWDLDPLFWPLTATETATIVVGIAPDNAFEVISETLMRAEESIAIEMYSLRHPSLVEALVQKAEAGVSVTLLLEGGIVGGWNNTDWHTELYACQQIEAAGGACWFMAHETDESIPIPDRIFNRYKYLHAKLIIVDDTWAVVSSQNFTWGGLPGDDKSNGTYGSRGAVIATTAPSVVERARTIFDLDLDPAHHNDLVRWNTAFVDKYGPPTPEMVDLAQPDAMTYTVRFSQPLVLHGTFPFELLTAPEAALRQNDALLGLVGRAGAGDKVYVEQLYEYATWGNSPNLRMKAYIDAARRGAEVRILVNGKNFAPYTEEAPIESRETISYVRRIAREENLNLQAASGDATGEGIHIKMVLVDLQDEGQYVHLGSINGSETSSKLNREVAIQIQSEGVYDYLLRMFRFDWGQATPIYLPLVMHNYTPPPPPVDYLVISEVFYTPGASNVGQEWVELYNPTPETIDLHPYKIGDAETPDRAEVMFQFPPGAEIPPQGVIVVAVNASEVPEANFEMYHTTSVTDMIRYTPWGQEWATWGLRNDGDQVLLLGPDDTPVDVLVWGDATYPGVAPHPGVAVSSASLERHPPYYDHDNCAEDFRERYPPTPGELSPVEERAVRHRAR